MCKKEIQPGEKFLSLKNTVSNHKHGNLINWAQSEDSIQDSILNMHLTLARHSHSQGHQHHLYNERVNKKKV